MQEYRKIEQKSNNPFESINPYVRPLFDGCYQIDKTSRFVGELNHFVREPVTTPAEERALNQLLRGLIWLGFIQKVRSENGDELADQLVSLKDALLKECERTRKAYLADVPDRLVHRRSVVGKPAR